MTEPTAQPARQGWPLWIKVLIPVVASVIFALILTVLLVNVLKPTKLQAAVDACEAGRYFDVRDAGRTLIIDGAGEGSDGAETADIACVLIELDTPSSVVAKMEGTRALDGRQTDEWGDIEVSWSYHPDNGFDLVFELK